MPSLLAFRANVVSLNTQSKDIQVVSPSYTFQWKERVVWAECKSCPKTKWGHVDIQEECYCGIHATLDPGELRDYAFLNEFSVPMMVEALDNVWMHDQGFTASGVAVVAVIKYKLELGKEDPWNNTLTLTYGKRNLALGIASKYFGVPIIDWETAVYAAEIKWREYQDEEGNPPFPYMLYQELFQFYPDSIQDPDGEETHGAWYPISHERIVA